MGRGGDGGRGSGSGRTSNDDRSDSMNPNNPAYDASVENRADQLNPDHHFTLAEMRINPRVMTKIRVMTKLNQVKEKVKGVC